MFRNIQNILQHTKYSNENNSITILFFSVMLNILLYDINVGEDKSWNRHNYFSEIINSVVSQSCLKNPS